MTAILTATSDESLLGVDDGGSVVVHGRHAPDEEEALGEPVERHPASDEVWEGAG